MSRSGPGRPRSEAARTAVVGAALELVAAGGAAAVTVEAVARTAGVSRQTVYRWWSSPAAILLEALNDGARALAPLQETGDLEDDLRTFTRLSVLGAQDPVRGLLVALMAEAQRDPKFGAAFRRGFLDQRRAVITGLLERAAERGDLRPGAEPGLLAEVLFGTLWYRLLAESGPIDDAFADALADTLLRLAYRT